MKASHLLLFSYLIMMVVIFVLPFYSAEGYSIIHNTTSELGAQNTPKSWIMNATFFLLGISCFLFSWQHLKEFWFHRVVLLVFSQSLILTAFFHHAPIHQETIYNQFEDDLHSVFATVTGFSFTLFAISTAFTQQGAKKKTLAISIGILATLLSLLMAYLPEYKGIWQRLIFILSFAWFIYFFRQFEHR